MDDIQGEGLRARHNRQRNTPFNETMMGSKLGDHVIVAFQDESLDPIKCIITGWDAHYLYIDVSGFTVAYNHDAIFSITSAVPEK